MSPRSHSTTRRSWIRASVLSPFTGGLLGGGSRSEGWPTTRSAARLSATERVAPTARERIRDRHLPNVPLRTHDNRLVRFYDDLIKDKVVVINFMYAECEGICPGITMNLARVHKLLGRRVGREIFMYSITLQPEHDTPAVLKAYTRDHGTGAGWTFLTGRPADVERLRRSLGFVDPDPELDKDKENHIGNIRYGNESLMLWAACPGMADAQWIVESVSWVIRR